MYKHRMGDRRRSSCSDLLSRKTFRNNRISYAETPGLRNNQVDIRDQRTCPSACSRDDIRTLKGFLKSIMIFIKVNIETYHKT
jgi:hypothetical protein